MSQEPASTLYCKLLKLDVQEETLQIVIDNPLYTLALAGFLKDLQARIEKTLPKSTATRTREIYASEIDRIPALVAELLGENPRLHGLRGRLKSKLNIPPGQFNYLLTQDLTVMRIFDEAVKKSLNPSGGSAES